MQVDRKMFAQFVVFAVWACGCSTAQAQVAIRPWFVGGGSFGTGVVDNFIDEVAETVQPQRQPPQEPGAKPAPQQAPNQSAQAGRNSRENPRKWGQVYVQMRQRELTVGMQDIPRRLSSIDFDPVTGRINWPQVFLDEKYSKLKKELEHLFSIRTSTAPTPEIATAIHEVIAQINEKLRNDIERLPANDYVAARKFIESLDLAVIAPTHTP